jgi:SPP1 family predicted phage head-tail adaptor
MPRPTAGQLRHPITIERLTTARDTHGGIVRSWTPVVSGIRAKVANLSGNEQSATAQGGMTGETRTEFTIRFVPNIDTSMRVKHGTRYHNIVHVNDFLEEHRFLVLTCDVGLADG